jgi:hypothetical protein
LGKGGSGVGERGLGGALVGQDQRVEAAATYLNWLKICMDPPLPPPFQPLKDKGRGCCYSKTRPKGGESAGEVNEVVCGVSKKSLGT